MTRVRISTTVDPNLLAEARRRHSRGTDAELLDAALTALLVAEKAAEFDAAYAAAYRRHPIDEPDEWGDLDSFRRAVGR